MSESSDTQNDSSSHSKSFRRHLNKLKELTPYGLLIASFMAGFTIGTQMYSTSLRNSEGEVARIKGEFAEYRAQHPPKSGEGENNLATHPVPPSTSQQTISKMSEDQGIIMVEVGKFGSIFGTDLLISFIEIPYSRDRFKVTATFASPGSEPLKVQGVEVGSKITYNGKDKYEVQILEANSFSVKFLIKRNRSR
jgi:hypothetical protein